MKKPAFKMSLGARGNWFSELWAVSLHINTETQTIVKYSCLTIRLKVTDISTVVVFPVRAPPVSIFKVLDITIPPTSHQMTTTDTIKS